MEPAGPTLVMVRVGGQGGWFSSTFYPLGSLEDTSAWGAGRAEGRGVWGPVSLAAPPLLSPFPKASLPLRPT